MKQILVLIVILIGNSATCQDVCDSLSQMKKEFYGFKPTSLNDSLQELKSNDLDKFWQLADKHKPVSLPCLQELIESEENDGFFCFDAASLLLSLDENKEYRKTIIKGLNKCETKEIQLSSLLRIIVHLSKEGQNVSELAVKYLTSSTNHASLVRHSMTLDRTFAGILIFGSMNDDLASSILVDILNSQWSAGVRHSSAILLSIQNTEFGNSVLDSLKYEDVIPDSTIITINKFKEAFEKPSTTGTYNRKKVLEKMSWVPFNFDKKWYGASGDPKFVYSACVNLNKDDIDLVREARIRTIFNASDEALYEYIELSKILFALRKME